MYVNFCKMSHIKNINHNFQRRKVPAHVRGDRGSRTDRAAASQSLTRDLHVATGSYSISFNQSDALRATARLAPSPAERCQTRICGDSDTTGSCCNSEQLCVNICFWFGFECVFVQYAVYCFVRMPQGNNFSIR